MSQLLGLLHGREETFPPALLAEINGRATGVHAESFLVSSVEAMDRSPYRLLVDRISDQVPYFASLLRQQQLVGTPVVPQLELAQLDRVGLAQLALLQKIHHPPTILLPHQSHPPGVDGEDLANLAYPLPWEQYLQRVHLPGSLRPAALGRGPRATFSSLSELWKRFAQTGHQLQVLQSELAGSQHLIVISLGKQHQVLGYEPMTGRYLAAPAGEVQDAAIQGTLQLGQRLDLFLTGVEWAWHRSQLWLCDLHRCPNLDWWSLGEEAFSRIVTACADELIRRTLAKTPPRLKQR